MSSNVMAFMLSEARIASLSARVGSSLEGTLAERITHMSQRLTLTARRSALLSGEPLNKFYFHFTLKSANTLLISDSILCFSGI